VRESLGDVNEGEVAIHGPKVRRFDFAVRCSCPPAFMAAKYGLSTEGSSWRSPATGTGNESSRGTVALGDRGVLVRVSSLNDPGFPPSGPSVQPAPSRDQLGVTLSVWEISTAWGFSAGSARCTATSGGTVANAVTCDVDPDRGERCRGSP